MLYFHDKDGNIANEYSESSGIKYVLEYNCRGKNINDEIDINEKRFIHVACDSKEYLDDWVNHHEVLLKTENKGYISYFEPDWCVRVTDGDFSFFSRSPIKIDWTKDYHFYDDKSYQCNLGVH